MLDCFKISSFQQSNKRFYPIYIIPPLTARVKDVDEKLSWLQISQHQFQENVTHRLAFVLVDGRDNKLDFSDLISVFLLGWYGNFHVGLLSAQRETMTDSSPCPVGKRRKAAPRRCRPLALLHLGTGCPKVNRGRSQSAAGPPPARRSQKPRGVLPPHAGCPWEKSHSFP